MKVAFITIFVFFIFIGFCLIIVANIMDKKEAYENEKEMKKIEKEHGSEYADLIRKEIKKIDNI